MGKSQLHHACAARPCWDAVTVTPEMLGRMPGYCSPGGPSFNLVLGPSLTRLPKRVSPPRSAKDGRTLRGSSVRGRPRVPPARCSRGAPRAIAAPRRQNATLVGLEPTTFE